MGIVTFFCLLPVDSIELDLLCSSCHSEIYPVSLPNQNFFFFFQVLDSPQNSTEANAPVSCIPLPDTYSSAPNPWHTSSSSLLISPPHPYSSTAWKVQIEYYIQTYMIVTNEHESIHEYMKLSITWKQKDREPKSIHLAITTNYIQRWRYQKKPSSDNLHNITTILFLAKSPNTNNRITKACSDHEWNPRNLGNLN